MWQCYWSINICISRWWSQLNGNKPSFLPCAAGGSQTWGEWCGGEDAGSPRPWIWFFLSSCTYWCLVKWFWSHHHIHMFISSHSLPLGRAPLRRIMWLANLLACTSCEMMSFGAWLFWYETFRSNVVTPTAVSPGDAEKTAMKSLSPDGGWEFFCFTVVTIAAWNSVTQLISIYCLKKRRKKKKK